MTAEQRRINDAFAEFEKQHCLDFEDFLDALAAHFDEQATQETDSGVKGCLLAVAVSLRAASFDFYASTK